MMINSLEEAIEACAEAVCRWRIPGFDSLSGKDFPFANKDRSDYTKVAFSFSEAEWGIVTSVMSVDGSYLNDDTAMRWVDQVMGYSIEMILCAVKLGNLLMSYEAFFERMKALIDGKPYEKAFPWLVAHLYRKKFNKYPPCEMFALLQDDFVVVGDQKGAVEVTAKPEVPKPDSAAVTPPEVDSEAPTVTWVEFCRNIGIDSSANVCFDGLGPVQTLGLLPWSGVGSRIVVAPVGFTRKKALHAYVTGLREGYSKTTSFGSGGMYRKEGTYHHYKAGYNKGHDFSRGMEDQNTWDTFCTFLGLSRDSAVIGFEGILCANSWTVFPWKHVEELIQASIHCKKKLHSYSVGLQDGYLNRMDLSRNVELVNEKEDGINLSYYKAGLEKGRREADAVRAKYAN